MTEAFPLSEEFGLPVLFRPTTRICHSKSDVEPGEVGTDHRTGHFERNPQQYVVIPAHTRVLHKKLNEKQAPLARALVEKGFNTAAVKGTTGIISGGIAASYVQELLPEGVSFAKIGAYPIDLEWLADVVGRHEAILVVEELSPVIEEAVRMVAKDTVVHGKMDGCLPYEGELDPASVARAMERAGFAATRTFPQVSPVPDIPRRPPILCAGCGHRSVFYAIKRVFKDGIFPSDIGCYTLGIQLGVVDTTICMGASITVGSGIAQSGEERDVVCTIGDSTFLHTGIQGLLNAVYNGANMTVVILDNRITAMTGHQPNPNTGVTATGVESPEVSLEAICRSCGANHVERVSSYDLTQCLEAMKTAKARKGVKVIIAYQPCVINARRAGIRHKTFTVDPDACTGCRACVRFGCPAIEFHDEKASINALCSGCSVCAQICPVGAIRMEGKK